MLVTCLITVVFKLGTIHFIQKEQVTGRVLNQSNINYLVDFSIEADSKRYIGDYSKVLVNKDLCVETSVASE